MKWTIAREVGLSNPVTARLKAANAINIFSCKIGASFPTRVTWSAKQSTIHFNDRINAMEEQFILRWEMQLLALTNNEQATPKPAGPPRL